MQRFARLYKATFANRIEQIKQIDMRYTNGFAVKWRANSENRSLAKTGRVSSNG
jgi:cell division protein FtsQ